MGSLKKQILGDCVKWKPLRWNEVRKKKRKI